MNIHVVFTEITEG